MLWLCRNGGTTHLDGFGDQVDGCCFATRLLTRPFGVSSLRNEVLYPQKDTRGDARSEREQSIERAAKELADDDDGEEDSSAQNVAASLEVLEHGLVADAGGVEKVHVGLLAVDGHVSGATGLDGVGRRRDILGPSVLLARLVRGRGDCSVLSEVLVGNGYLPIVVLVWVLERAGLDTRRERKGYGMISRGGFQQRP